MMLSCYQIQKEEERQEMLKGRRATIADLNKYHKEVTIIYKKSQKENDDMQELKIKRTNPKGKGAGETINLEKQFVKGLQNLGGIYGLPTSLHCTVQQTIDLNGLLDVLIISLLT